MLESNLEHVARLNADPSNHEPSFLNQLSSHLPVVSTGPDYELAYSSSSSSHSPPLSAKVTYSQLGQGSIFSVPKTFCGFESSKDSLIVSIYEFLKAFMSASGNSQGAIDNRIEQAMDLVKSHLMNAVRSEVEELKEKIIGLETKIDHLQSENEILKAHAPSDIIQQLPQLAPTPPQMILAPPPAANNANMNNIMTGPPQPIAIQPPQQQQQPQQQQPVVSNGMINGHAHPQQTNNGPPTAQRN